jgi:hypothetical protein
MATKKKKGHTCSEAEKTYWYEKGVGEGRKQITDKLVTLLGLDDRFSGVDHCHYFGGENN